MAILTPALINALQVGFRKEFQNGLGMADPQWQRIATLIPSSGKSTTYGWLGKFPKFREWIGPRVINDMQAHGYSIVNKDWESTIGVDRNDIEDDEVGIYNPLFQEMGMAAAGFADEQVFPLLDAGTTNLCYDGQNYFDTDHPVYANADGSGAAVSVSNFTDGAGPAWFLMDVRRPLKPIIFQERKKVKFDRMDKADDEEVFMRKQFRYGADCRANAGYGFWQLAHCSKAELTPENIWAAYQAMRSVKADGGKPLGVRPGLLVVRAGQEKKAEDALKQLINGGESNTLHGKLELLVPDWLDYEVTSPRV
ncbi:Uncharacterised protein [BD1-7 clade bacterium]|uniref:Bacteriophage Mu GpT domain-containing protein n=1 Tax=BD1-7 clade bacterium TaxID=2029982 RepID=A0A5S9Q3E9_9GAMM|nr:Uncharacterised protein [BD1-7 clade bacterium]CAA0111715.1 Uncharacterised protein [BD1-7 clade bacterium]